MNSIRPKNYEQGHFSTYGMALYSAEGPFKRMQFQRRALGPNDVAIKIEYCGICHSDIHQCREHWGKQIFPLIPGHEISGIVAAIGADVSKFKVGARVGVGCMVNSCHHCYQCKMGLEQYCTSGPVLTYGSKDRDGSMTQGGYSTFIVVNEDFIVKIPDSIDLADAASMMCAGITVYSPFRHWNVGPGKSVGIVGLGGLGHMGVKIASAMGADVMVLTTSKDKIDDARRFGAKNVILNEKEADLSKYKHSLDFILDTVPYKHDLDRLIPLLKLNSTLCVVGIGKVNEPNQFDPFTLILGRNALAGSLIGGIKETQELVDFCSSNKIRPDITKISMEKIDDAWNQVIDKKARYRFVIDMTGDKNE